MTEEREGPRDGPRIGDAEGGPWLRASILLVSAVGLAYEVVLMRVFSVGQWHHFAYMVISVAMLGFAASGTALALLRRRIRGREATLYRIAAAALPVALVGCYAASQAIPFETFELATRPVQFWWLFALYLVLALPFFLAASCIALGFLLEPGRVGRVYYHNLLGSGLGAAAVVGLLFLAPPGRAAVLLAIPAGLAALLAIRGSPRPLLWILVLAVVSGPVLVLRDTPIRISEYKGLAGALRLPDARVVAEEESPLSVLTAVASEQIRETPGQLSAAYPWAERGGLPEQRALFFDAGGASAVHRFDGDLEPFEWLDWVTPALPYRLAERPRVLVVGAGGGTEVLNALAHGARHVTAVEVDPEVFPLVRGPLGEFSGGLYDRPDVRTVQAEGRGWVESGDRTYDLIQVSLLDSFGAAAAGVHALSESYLYTVEAARTFFEALSPEGVLSVTRWLETPPRDAVKLFATLVEAAERAGVREPGRHLAFVRSWNTGTVVLSRSPLDEDGIRAVRRFAEERWFDLAWLPGMVEGEANRYTVLEEPAYHLAARAILSPRREAFFRNHPFHVRPATDDRPYFFRFFRWASLPEMLDRVGPRLVNFVEWGYLALVATVVQAAVAGVVLVLLPLLLLGRRTAGGPDPGGTFPGGPDAGDPGGGTDAGDPRDAAGRVPAVVYFGALGLAFMFLEIAFIQKLMLFLDDPIYAVAVVLASFLVFSGLGSYVADRRPAPPVRTVGAAVAGLAVLVAGYLLALPAVFAAGSGWPAAVRAAASVALLSPLAFVMGIPFPTGLQAVSDRRPWLVPWGWGVNGATSVLGAALATLVAVHLGFRAVLLAALGFYAGAAVTLRWLADGDGSTEGGGAWGKAGARRPGRAWARHES